MNIQRTRTAAAVVVILLLVAAVIAVTGSRPYLVAAPEPAHEPPVLLPLEVFARLLVDEDLLLTYAELLERDQLALFILCDS